MTSYFSPDQIFLLQHVNDCARKCSFAVYLIGGVVRDILLQSRVDEKDLDFIVEGDSEVLAKVCKTVLEGEVKTFPEFLTAKLIHPNKLSSIHEIDFASSRKEIYPKPGKLPVVSQGNIQEDLYRRDFSTNAVALPLSNLVAWINEGSGDIKRLRHHALDPFKGLEDLQKGALRVLHDKSFLDDPTRIYRGHRYKTRFGGSFEAHTNKLLQDALNGGALNTISHVRKFNELKKIFEEEKWFQILQDLAESGILKLMKLVDEGKEQDVMRCFQKLNSQHDYADDSRGNCDPALLYSISQWIFFSFMDPSVAEERFLEFGFGKKLAKKIRRETATVGQGAQAKNLSQEAQLWRVITS